MPSSRVLHLFDAALAIWVAAWIALGVAIGVNVGRLTALSETVAQDGRGGRDGRAFAALAGQPALGTSRQSGNAGGVDFVRAVTEAPGCPAVAGK